LEKHVFLKKFTEKCLQQKYKGNDLVIFNNKSINNRKSKNYWMNLW
jgi:hypothetical protein